MTCGAQCGTVSALTLQTLNETCACMPISSQLVVDAIARDSQILQTAFAERSVLFATTPVFLCAADVGYIEDLVQAIETALHSSSYRALADQRDTPEDPQPAAPTPGLFMAYDFHITEEGPKLIEINTNAGGAFLVQGMYESVAARVPLCGGNWGTPSEPDWMYQMLVNEWRSAGRTGVPARLAIVDDAPHQQFLQPDFELARQYFEAYGIEVIIADPEDCVLRNSRFEVAGCKVDMIYNRITDFRFSDPRHKVLLEAWQSGAAILSPSPEHHNRYADKRNLGWLTDEQNPARNSLTGRLLDLLATIPKVQEVSEDNAEALWANRKQLFFKPAGGFGSRGAFRGAKLTKKVWAEITTLPAGSYVAQQLVQAPLRHIGGVEQALKYDIRAYTYAGGIKLLAARVYQGQTTNFRTPGGGFAPVVIMENISRL